MEPKTTDKPKAPQPDTKLGRLTNEAKGLVDDTKLWVEAKIRLLELDLEEKIDGIASKMIAGASVVFLAALALIFALTALALLLGDLWENQALGFITVAVVCFLLALLIQWLRPRFVRGSMGFSDRANEKDPPGKLPAIPDPRQLPPANGKQ